MKLGGAPGTVLACGIAPDSIRCAMTEVQYKLHPNIMPEYSVFFKAPTYE